MHDEDSTDVQFGFGVNKYNNETRFLFHYAMGDGDVAVVVALRQAAVQQLLDAESTFGASLRAAGESYAAMLGLTGPNLDSMKQQIVEQMVAFAGPGRRPVLHMVEEQIEAPIQINQSKRDTLVVERGEQALQALRDACDAALTSPDAAVGVVLAIPGVVSTLEERFKDDKMFCGVLAQVLTALWSV
ncbi:MAG: hypothetical protein AAB426_06690 [Myxococcota bacterium]